jgi:prepilin-type N-terminal cleavage/methylation domain-containing protein
MTHRRKHQSGYTLVEIAIVLVIIGLLLGGVLKGQELIYNQKVKSTYDNYRQFTAAMYGYQDRYKALPGDDAQATKRGFIPGPTDPAIADGNGDGYIAGGNNQCLVAGNSGLEVCQAAYHLRLSGFLTGQGTISAEHPLGGVVTLNAPVAAMGFPASFVAPTAVCWHGLPNKAAQQIDVSYDDGRATTGSMQGSADYTTLTAALPNTPSAAWTCMTN